MRHIWTARRDWLAPAVFFLAGAAYLPGAASVSVAGRWAAVTVGAALLMTTVELAVDAVTLCAAALVVWILLGLFWSASPVDTFGGVVRWVPLVAIMVWASRQRDMGATWTAYAVGVSLSLPFALAQWLGCHPVEDLGSIGFEPIGGLFLTANVLAEASVLAAVAMVGVGRPLLAIAPAASAILTGEREPVLMAAVAGLCWLWTARRDRRRELVAGAVAVVVGLVFYLWWADKLGSDQTRLMIWRDTLGGVTFLGSGLNVYAGAFQHYVFAHCDPLQLAYELGVGSILIFWIAGHALGSQLLPERPMFAALCAAALVWAPLEDPATAVVAFALAGRLLGERARRDRFQLDRGAGDMARPDAADPVAIDPIRAAGRVGAVVSARPQSAVGAGRIQADGRGARRRPALAREG